MAKRGAKRNKKTTPKAKTKVPTPSFSLPFKLALPDIKMPNIGSARSRDVGIVVLALLAAFIVVSLISYTPSDPDLVYAGEPIAIQNYGGILGAGISHALMLTLGYVSYIFALFLGMLAYFFYQLRSEDRSSDAMPIRLIGLVLLGIAATGLASMHWDVVPNELPNNDAGGVIGAYLGYYVQAFVGFVMATTVLFLLFMTGLTLLCSINWYLIMDTLGFYILKVFGQVQHKAERVQEVRQEHKEIKTVKEERRETVKTERKAREQREEPTISVAPTKIKESKRAVKEKQASLFSSPDGALPPLDLLDPPPPRGKGYSEAALKAMSQQVEMKLKDFGIVVEVISANSGPVITCFELEPAPGVKVSQINNVAKDLARALSSVSVRVVDIIPGKPYVGLEIPNQQRDIVALREILSSAAYEDMRSPLTLSLGKDIGGQPVVSDLAKMPHLLVAGTTGSGKSVAINTMLLSILYKSTPQEVRLLLVDPKVVEMGSYQGIPHLIAPVVTDMTEACNGLNWCVREMERRYQLMAALSVRNLAGYNRKIREAEEAGKPLADPTYQPDLSLIDDDELEIPRLSTLPHIVITIDELADLMMQVGKKAEELIVRLAQKARACGMHLILATQRPSVDVITGLIKSNVPTRMAFQVSSKVDSRTILDQMGAESLLGQGDMLFLPPGKPLPVRVHGAFVGDDEVNDVIEFIKNHHGEPQYIDGVLEGPGAGAEEGGGGGGLADADEESDPLYDEAVQIVLDTRRASISGIQRRLRIGYNRAARIVEHMEKVGIVGPLKSNGSRDILVPNAGAEE